MTNTITLLHDLSRQLLTQNATVTCAESCTGGMLAAELTRLPGSSAWFNMGFVTYSNAAKNQLLGVDTVFIDRNGAVSEAVAGAMAAGAKQRANANFAVAISGIAGPTGGSAAKPVGTVCFAVASDQGLSSTTQHFSGDRNAIRHAAVIHALQLLINASQS